MNEKREAGGRLHYLDNLRFLLVILVVIHHVGQAYGPTGGAWPVNDGPKIDFLGRFFPVNAGFFMGLLFMISGYLLPGAYSRSGPVRFTAGKVRRLAVPALAVMFVLGLFTYLSGDFGGIGEFLASLRMPEGMQQVTGHLWYVIHLLFYSLCYLLFMGIYRAFATAGRKTVPSENTISSSIFSLSTVLLIVLVTAAGFLVRLSWPIDRWVLIFGFIPAEAAHLPQYLSMFVLGLLAARYNWFARISKPDGYLWLTIGLLAAIFRYSPFYDSVYAYLASESAGNSGVIFYRTIWESVLCAGLSIGLLVVCREKLNFTNRLLKFHSDSSYGLYLIHVFIVVGLQLLFYNLEIPTWIKFTFVSAAAVYTGAGLVMLMRKASLLRAYI